MVTKPDDGEIVESIFEVFLLGIPPFP